MKNSTNGNNKKGIGALDAVIIIALVACIAAGVLAFLYSRSTADPVATENDMEDYVISFEIYGIRQSNAQMLKTGEKYYTSESEEFGVMNENLTITPAVVYVQGEDGKCYKSYAPENGDYTKVDISGSMTVKGVRDSKGYFLLNGSTKLMPNKSIIVRNGTIAVNINITGIEKVSG